MPSCSAPTRIGGGVKRRKSSKVWECFAFPLPPLHPPRTADASYGEKQWTKQRNCRDGKLQRRYSHVKFPSNHS